MAVKKVDLGNVVGPKGDKGDKGDTGPEPVPRAGEYKEYSDDTKPASIYGGTWTQLPTHSFCGKRSWYRVS